MLLTGGIHSDRVTYMESGRRLFTVTNRGLWKTGELLPHILCIVIIILRLFIANYDGECGWAAGLSVAGRENQFEHSNT